MTERTKIDLSSKELELVCNTNWILTRHVIIKKVYELFGQVLPHLEKSLAAGKAQLPREVFIKQPKISRGENYQQLPYVILDYPGYFSREDTVAIRTFFWWGNFFSVALQLSGNVKEDMCLRIRSHFNYLQQNDFWICVNNDPWEHHFDKSNYLYIGDITSENFEDILYREPFIKIAKKIPLQQWQDVPGFITNSFDEIVQMLKTG